MQDHKYDGGNKKKKISIFDNIWKAANQQIDKKTTFLLIDGNVSEEAEVDTLSY